MPHKILSKDRFFLLNQLNKAGSPEKLSEKDQLKWMRSEELWAQRDAAVPEITYTKDLPVSEQADEICEAIKNNQVVIVAGETGSGKTTQLPKICLAAGRGRAGLIGHTQPRRLAARSVASRIAEEMQVKFGEQVGYQVRFEDKVSNNTLVKLMTDGILLAETQHDRFLSKYDTIIIDEAHERSLNIDFLMGYLKNLLNKRKDLKVIITSATIDVERFSKHFNQAPVFEVSGRTFPVHQHYLPIEDEELPAKVVTAFEEILALEKSGNTPSKGGDVLVFLPGERDIREAADALRHAEFNHLEVLPLYARLTAAEQQRIFQSHSGRRIILSTNVAETSLTVPGIHYVIDPGLVRMSRYSYRSKVQRLPIEAISQASANQRAGRCGRVSEGLCVRLYSEEDYLSRPEFTDPEIKRTNLASVILQMAHLRLGDVLKFPFLEMPDSRLVKDGYTLLTELGAVKKGNKLTQQGRMMAKLPVDPRLARMVLEAGKNNALSELLIIVSALSIQDPRERPREKQAQAAEKHNQDKDKDSDFSSILNLWYRYEQTRQELSGNQLKKFCKQQFLNYLRMREWRDIHRQLVLACKPLNFKMNDTTAGFDAVHKSILSGLLSQIATLKEERKYSAARNKECVIGTGSSLGRKTPKWIMAGELTETNQLYARYVASIESGWIEQLSKHLSKSHYLEPHWSKKRAQVVAKEKVMLYGLTLVADRIVNYGRVNPVEAREIFIRQGLVEDQYISKLPFLKYNRALVDDIELLEAKSRRRDILVDDETLYQFYDERIPADIVNGIGFESWVKKEKPDLKLDEEVLMRHGADNVTDYDFPDVFDAGEIKLPLEYQFDPAKEHDGVTLKVPVGAVRQLPLNKLDWLVPGFLEEKCIALVKSLPKSIRRNFVPVPDVVKTALEGMNFEDLPLTEALGLRLKRMKGITIPVDAWDLSKIESHLQMRIEVVDAKGKVLMRERDASELMHKVEDLPEQPVEKHTAKIEVSGLTDFDIDTLPETYEYKQAGMMIKAYPALVDDGDSVSVKLFDNPIWAKEQHKKGLVRLLRLQLKQQEKYVADNLPKFKQTALYFATVGKAQALKNDIINAGFIHCFLTGELPRSRAQFDQLIADKKAELAEVSFHLAELCFEVLKNYHQVAKLSKGKISFALAFVYADIKAQMSQLVYAGFVSETPLEWFEHLPRFIEGAVQRLNRNGAVTGKENMVIDEFKDFWQRYEARKARHDKELKYDAELTLFRWLLEEYRISLFAQTLGTSITASSKRLEKQWTLVSQ